MTGKLSFMSLLGAAALLAPASASIAASTDDGKPLAAPPNYSSDQYNLNFRVPKGAFYCPLPNDWIGSDHGTAIFLERPRFCGGTGYSSSSRHYYDDPATISIYYGYYDKEDALPLPPCRKVATITFLGKQRAVCETRGKGLIERSVNAKFKTYIWEETQLTLTTRPSRLRSDMTIFERTAASVRLCRSGKHGGGSQTVKGPLCWDAGVRF